MTALLNRIHARVGDPTFRGGDNPVATRQKRPPLSTSTSFLHLNKLWLVPKYVGPQESRDWKLRA